ncbi:MAG TPA: TetR/AcrR family transcriptional regulator [Solirubrobacteraceae bacterium]|jgi:AcrR family transcriptional regulator|nr:TetR/AcrR family transcriptional regulator [Solirubrobacteraceae bacterium]
MAVVENTYTGSVGPSTGRHGLSAVHVAQIQRSRMVAAAVLVVEEVGYARMTVAQVIARARVSRKTFYEVFADREDCFLAAFDQALSQARTLVTDAFRRESEWHEGIRAALTSLLILMDEERALAKLCLVQASAAGPRVVARRAAVLDELAKVVDRGRSLTYGAGEPPVLTAEGIVGAVFAVLHRRLLDDRPEPLTDVLGSLMSMIVLPYLGPPAASRELNRPAPQTPGGIGSRRAPSGKDPLEGLNIRLTYRTVRVLTFVAENRGASNSETAAGAEIEDPGQVSKLLSRLAGLGLVRNLGDRRGGTANAWGLTPRGERLERAARPRA